MTGKLKKVLLPNLPYLLFVWLFDKLCQAVRLSPGRTLRKSCFVSLRASPRPLPPSGSACILWTCCWAWPGRRSSGWRCI